MPKVSIIVPVYNVEEYLERCLDSLVNQTLKDIEIIIVNDGSTDGSKEKIQKYINKYKNIVYLEKLTGLDTKTLLSDFVFDNLNERDIETNINSSLLQCEYYEYL